MKVSYGPAPVTELRNGETENSTEVGEVCQLRGDFHLHGGTEAHHGLDGHALLLLVSVFLSLGLGGSPHTQHHWGLCSVLELQQHHQLSVNKMVNGKW